uniref:Uncharacterized protein n=1 Tax=Anguilla anguilla TaxID=7936 RepID=A0A0E9XLN5_ANGAN
MPNAYLALTRLTSCDRLYIWLIHTMSIFFFKPNETFCTYL